MQIHGPTVRFGLHSGQQYTSFAGMLAVWQRAEALGYDWVSLFDHLRPHLGGPAGPCLEGTTALAALAARTTRIRCAILVSAVTWRHPALTATIAATIDQVCAGRLEFGIGAAGHDLGYAQYGIPFPCADERMDMLHEACLVLRALWAGGPTTFHGRYFRLTDAYLAPKPVQPRLPLVVGGGGERRLLRVVAEHADIWNTLAVSPIRYRRKVDALARHCDAVGRPPDDIRRSVTFRALLAGTERAARGREDALRRAISPGSPDLAEYLVFGTPGQCVDRLLGYAELGVRDFVLGVRPPVDWQTVELFAHHVAPALRARIAAGSTTATSTGRDRRP